ncbi:Exosome complex component rrp4 [Mitosporidium daphniae]
MASNWIHELLVHGSNKLIHDRKPPISSSSFYTPGDLITNDIESFICGNGTILDSSNSSILSTVAGNVEYINKLIRVIPPKARYLGEIGDVIVGRVIRVCQRKWAIDLNGQQPATLQLSAIYLPGGIQRRKLEEDELLIRQFFVEGDLISAEVQAIHADGSVSIHTRSVKYGKLCNGIFVAVNPRNIQRSKFHFVSLACGVDLIIGINGFIWIGLPEDTQARLNTANVVDGNPYALANRNLSVDDRLLLSRVRNCILILDTHSISISISETSIQNCLQISSDFEVPCLLDRDISISIASRLFKDAYK